MASTPPIFREHPAQVWEIVQAVLDAADARGVVERGWPEELEEDRSVRILAFGKASIGMAAAAQERLGPRLVEGLVIGLPEAIEIGCTDSPEPGGQAMGSGGRSRNPIAGAQGSVGIGVRSASDMGAGLSPHP